jgi:hypothetical protein
MFKIAVLSSAFVLLSVGCSDDKNAFNFGAPAVAPNVDSATPSGLKDGNALHGTAEFLNLIDTASTEESFKSYVTNYVFKKDTTGKVAGPVYYRNWVDVLDSGISQVDSRILLHVSFHLG